MFLCGVPVHSSLVSTLAVIVKDARVSEKLTSSVKRDVIAIRLDEEERAIVLKALAEPPPELEEIRDALLAQQIHRRAEPVT